MRKWGGVRVTLVGLITLVSMSEQLIFGDKQVAAAQSSAKQPSPFGALDFASHKEPIHIRSHDLEFFYNEKRIVYRGSVVATQGDSTLKSNTLTVTYEDAMTKAAAQGEGANTTQGQQIKEIVAEEDVEITSTTRRATCNKAVFSDASRTIILTGNAVLRDGTNEVTGQKVTIYVDEGRTTVEGSPTMVLTPKQEDKGKKGEGVR
jgi:lipopolysaccharide export system protein LptA